MGQELSYCPAYKEGAAYKRGRYAGGGQHVTGAAENLKRVLQELSSRLERFRAKRLKEESTKSGFVEPVLAALDWQVSDFDVVEEQFQVRGGGAVDYALKINDRPVLFVEAKSLREALDDDKWIAQAIKYAAAEDVDWCILTNGSEWRCYRVHEKGSMEERELFRAEISDAAAHGPLQLLLRDGVPKALEEEAHRVFPDRKVRAAVEKLLEEPQAQALLNLVKKRVPELSSKEIRASLHRLNIRVELTKEPQPPPQPPDDLEGLFKRCAASPESRHLFEVLDEAVFTLGGNVLRQIKKWYVRYEASGKTFGSVVPLKSSLRAFVYVPPSDLPTSVDQALVRDVRGVGHYGIGDTEIRCADESAVRSAMAAMRASYEKVREGAA